MTRDALYSGRLDQGQAKALLAWMRGHDFEMREAPHAEFAGAKGNVNVVFYKSGKLVIQGKGTREFVEFVLEPQITGRAEIGYEEVLHPEQFLPRLGIDESGKGDFFGPLCVAGVYANGEIVKGWREAGVADSKRIGSDRRIGELAKIIRETPGCVYAVVPIGPEAYNRLHAKMRNVNSILAWGHARVIENLMLQTGRMDPPPVRAVSDQFASTEKTVRNALMQMGKKIELIQRHRAEEDIAVAAASILARAEFVDRLSRLGKKRGAQLPKGASAAVIEAGVGLVERFGESVLNEVGKRHFQTSSRILARARGTERAVE